MAWIYLAELGDSQSPLSLGCKQLPTVSKTDMLKPFSCPECNRVTWIELQSGTTSKRSEEKCCQKLRSSLEDSHAKTSALRELEKAWRESEVDFSLKLSAWSKSSHPNSSFWKTSQPSELGVFLQSSMNLPRSGMTVAGLVYQPQALEPRTKETDGFVLLPTPSASSYGTNKGGAAGRVGPERMSLDTMARKNLWPTPTARDWKSGSMGTQGNSRPLSEQIGGPLNPQWVEWLMGFRLGWTELSAWAMPWCRSKRKKLLKNL